MLFQLSLLVQAVSIKNTHYQKLWRDPDGNILRHGNIFAYFRDERYYRPRIWSNWISSWSVKQSLRLTLLTWTALMCPVGALDAWDVWLGKTPCFPPLLLLRDKQRVFNTSWQEEYNLKGWQNQCSYTCPESPPGHLHTFLTKWRQNGLGKQICSRPPALPDLFTRVTDCKFVSRFFVRVDYCRVL